jgi:hypothetical protein
LPPGLGLIPGLLLSAHSCAASSQDFFCSAFHYPTMATLLSVTLFMVSKFIQSGNSDGNLAECRLKINRMKEL